jgi:hypothetical protein
MQILTVDALAGAAKTYNAIRFATAAVRAGEKYIFCVPSTRLAIQVEKDSQKAGCSAVTAIHSEDGKDGSVVARLIHHFQNTDHDRGEVLILTMAALDRLKYIERKSSWHVIVDELPSPVFHLPISLHENRHHLLDLFTPQPWNAAYGLMHANEADTGRVADIARNRYLDQITHQVSEVANKLLSDHWRCFALNDQLARFRGPADGQNTLDFFGLLQPSIFNGFKSVTLMGACLEESLLYRHWLSMGVDFVPHSQIKARFTECPNGGLVTIQYAIDRDWSAGLRDMDGIFENIVGRCKAALKGKQYVFLVNKGIEMASLNDGLQLPHTSHGLNHFMGFHNAMLLSALNPPPAYFGFCSDMMGLDGDEVRTAIYRTAVYQAAMRISIRNLDDLNAKRVQVVDKATALWLSGLITGSKIEKLPGDDPAPEDRRRVCKPKTTAERWSTHRQKIKRELVAGLDRLNKMHSKNPTNDILYKKDTVSLDSHLGSIFHDKFSRYGISTSAISVNSFRTLLAEAHQQVIGAKDHRCLISPGVYDPNLDNTWRGNGNLVSLSGVWMDNDGGDLTPDAFAKMLRIPLIIFNTFSSTTADPRWRVWIPTSHLLTPAAHKEIIAQVRKMLIDRKFYGKGYSAKHPDRVVKHHGFDEGKFAPASLFHLPAQSKAGKDASFFLEYNWECGLLNPYEWIDRSIVDHREPAIVKTIETLSLATKQADGSKVEKAEENWRTHDHGDGNRAFFRLAVAYRHAGLGWFDAEPLLRQQAQLAHGRQSMNERLKDLKGYERKLW